MKIALYMRLSRPDGTDAESNSISNQRRILVDYAEKHFPGREKMDYVDDGYSGANFDRPAFKQMISDCQKGIVDIIIVKDMSRFGRNDVDVTDYIEQIFPLMDIRLISILDKFDTAKTSDGTLDMTTSMMNLVNTYYVHDIAKKVRCSMESSMKEGSLISRRTPFGYACDDREEGWKIDEKQGGIVRHIFDLALEGKRATEIADTLNREKTPTRMQLTGTGKNVVPEKFIEWNCAMVADILKNETYTGTLIQGKKRVLIPGKKVQKAMDVSDQFRHEGHHAAIVTREEWEKAQELTRGRERREPRTVNEWPLKGKVRCEICNSSVGKLYNNSIRCCRARCGTQISLNTLNASVMASIARKRDLAAEEMKQIPIICDSEEREKIEKLTDLHVRLYEMYADGEMTREAFREQENAVWQEMEELKATVKEKAHQQAQCEEKRARLQWFLGKSHGELSAQMAGDIIEKVVVGDRVTVYFKET